jgi:subtilase family serine protease
MIRGSKQLSRRGSPRRWVAGGLVASVVGCCAIASTTERDGVARADATLSHGYSPQTVQRVYGVSPLLRRGIDGRGETVVLPETIPPGSQPLDTNLRQDLAAFDTRNHLRAVDLTMEKALGFTGETALADGEEVQDAEMVHTIAPGAKIAVMLAPFRAFAFPSGMAALLRAAAGRGNVVSFSQSECERTSCLSAGQLRSLNGALREARDRHVSIFASAGDDGPLSGGLRGGKEVTAPGSSPLVTSVGGTTLTARHGAYGSESVWTDNINHPTSSGARLSATGGGLSTRYARPGYQNGLPVIGNHRGVPDVAAMAQPGMATVLLRGGHDHIFPAGGTSESAPLWAGIAVLADQDAHRQLGFLNAGLYRIGRSPMYQRAFHDITHGNNTVTLPSGKNVVGYSASRGWDPVTGWGTPNAQVLVPLLAKAVHPGDGRGL